MKNAKESTNYKSTIANHNLIMLATVGSAMLGLNTSKSDIDEMGICLESPKQLLGFAPFEHDVYRTATDRTGRTDAPSEPGDIDLSIYGLRKFVKMSLSGNPNLISLLFLPRDRFTVYTPIASELQGLCKSFVSKLAIKAFLGYLRSQRSRLENARRNDDNPDQQQYRYDAPFATHMFRLALQGYELASTGRLEFPIKNSSLETLNRIKRRELPFNTLIKNTAYYEEITSDALVNSELPNTPDYDTIEHWLIATYNKEWNENKTNTPNIPQAKASSEEIELEYPF